MLSSPSCLLRSACLQSHSHPLQCKALELCFNVALNRLPATSSSIPMLGHHLSFHHHAPALSNALIAAFKRAQAHQRRGLVESQQQSLLTVKIELEQLIISILDDPSVSRVMREAGFSSTQVKTNVEQSISTDICASNTNSNPNPNKQKDQITQSMKGRDIYTEDVKSILDTLAGRKKRSLVIVGESLSTSEATVRRISDMITKGEVVETLKGIQFISILVSTFVNMSNDEVQVRIAELKCHVKSSLMERGALLYLGDLNWTAEHWSSCRETKRGSYSSVETVLREIAKMVFGSIVEENGAAELWLLSTATFQAFMKCSVGNPSLESLLGLHPITIPAGIFNLGLNFDSPVTIDSRNQDVTSSRDDEAKLHLEPMSYKVPSWLKVLKKENTSDNISSLQERVFWNFMGSPSSKCKHHRLERTLSFSSATPASSSHEQNPFGLYRAIHSWPISAPTSRAGSPEHTQQRVVHTINPNSCSSSETMEIEYVSRFRELSAQNLKLLCTVLDRMVPLHKDIISDIASTILQCRSGLLKRKESSVSSRKKEDAWLLFLGNDSHGKVIIAREIALVIFGSLNNFTLIDLNASSFTRSSSDEIHNKRLRSDRERSFVEQFLVALRNNPHCVVMVEDVEQLDEESQLCIKDAIEKGMIRGSNGEEVTVGDAVIILCCQGFELKSSSCSPLINKEMGDDEDKDKDCEEISSAVRFDLNLSSEDEIQSSFFDDVCLLEAVDRAFLLQLS